MYNTNSQTKFKTSMLNSCDYSNDHVLDSGTIKITGTTTDDPTKRED